MKSEQEKQTQEKQLQPEIYHFHDDADPFEQFETSAETLHRREKKRNEGDKKQMIADSIVEDRQYSDVPSKFPKNVDNYEGLNGITHWFYAFWFFFHVFREVFVRSVHNNKSIRSITQGGGKSKDGERKNGNAQNHERKEESKQYTGGGGHSGHFGPVFTSTSGSSSGGDGDDGRGNDDWNKTKRDSFGNVDPEQEEAEQNEAETEEIKETEKEQTRSDAECVGRGEDGDVCRCERTGLSTDKDCEQEQESAVNTVARTLKPQQFTQNFPLLPNNLRNCIARRSPIFQTLSVILRKPLQQFPFGLNDCLFLPGLFLTGVQDILRRSNNGLPGYQRFQVLIFTVHVFLQGHERIYSLVIFTDTDLFLFPDPRNPFPQLPQSMQNILKDFLFWALLSSQRSTTSRVLGRGQSILSFSQTTNCIQTISGPLDRREFTVSATLCPQQYHSQGRPILLKSRSKVDLQFQGITGSKAEKPQPIIRRSPKDRRAGSSRQTERSYTPMAQSQQDLANSLQTEPLPLAPPNKGRSDPRVLSRKIADTGTTKPTVPERESTFHSHGCSAFGANVSPTRGHPGPPTPSSQDKSGNRDRRDYRTAPGFLPSRAKRDVGPPNWASCQGFKLPSMGMQPYSRHAEDRPNPNPDPVRGLRGFPFEPDQNEHENRAQDFSQAQHRPQRGGRRPYLVLPQDLTAPPNSSLDHDVNQRRQETTGGLRSTPQQQHSTNHGELPFPTPCQEDVHRDPANPSAASNHGEVPHDTANGGPAQQGPPAPNNSQRCQINLRGCTVVAKPDHLTAAQLDIRLHELFAENRRLHQVFMCQICQLQRFTRVFYPCGHRACEYCSSILRFCCICKRWIQDKFPASFE